MSIPIENFHDVTRSLDSLQPQKLPEMINLIHESLKSYEWDIEKFRYSLYILADSIMKMKDVKDEYVYYFEELINLIIKIAIEKQFKVGSDAFKIIFLVSSQFYKTANIDPLLSYPIGKDRPLQIYCPKVGEQCDVVKPYITSTSFCGWTRCTVLQIEKNKYTIKFANTDGPSVTRELPWFAPLGSRMKDYNWRMGLDIGEPIDAYLNRIWYKSTITEIATENEVKKVRVTFRRFDENGDRVDSLGNRFFGLKSEDEWIDVLSPRIQQSGKMSDIPFCSYTFESQQILHDDFYDTLFEQEYFEKQFYSIMRIVNNKSLSLMSFINTFVCHGGIEMAIKMMDDDEIKDQYIFVVIACIGTMTHFFPRMFVKRSPLYELYDKILPLIERNIKNLNSSKVETIYYGFDNIGRRLFSLTKIHQDQNQLRKMLIKEFIKMNLQKQMLSLRYLNHLIFPKKALNEEEKRSLDKFIQDQNIFNQLFNQNTHQQIISRCGFFLQYVIEKEIITLRQFQTIWYIAPTSDLRGRAVIEKLLTQSCKKLPIPFVRFLLQKILNLKQTELTLENLNLLKQIKNREIGNEDQLKTLRFLWQTLTVKSINIKTNIEEQVEKVFKSFVSTLNDPKVRMGVLESMTQKLHDCKKVKNEIELLKDFIRSYPEKIEPNQMKEENIEGVPLTIFQAVSFLKSQNIYQSLLNLLAKSKQQPIRKDILQFFSFLFENDNSDVNPIISQIYQRLGPNENFFDWVHKILARSLRFVSQFLDKTSDFSKFTQITQQSFESLEGIIIDYNELQNNIKVIKTHHFKNPSDQASITGDAGKSQSKQASYPSNSNSSGDKVPFIGPVLPETKKNIFVLISPFKLVGMKFLEHLLQVVKSTTVFNANVKLIIKLISNLDESIESKTQVFRRQFLEDIITQIKSIVQQNKCDEKIKAKIQVYCKLIAEVFAETEVKGIGNLVPHFSTIEGQYITLVAENGFSKQKEKINILCNENFTFWKLKLEIAEILNMRVENIDIIKYVDPMPDSNNSKSLNDLSFYDKETIKIVKKAPKLIVRGSLVNEGKSEVSSKFKRIIVGWFNKYKNETTNLMSADQFKRLNKQQWKGIEFKKQQTLNKILIDHDKDNKGGLSETEFEELFYAKSISNPNAIWKLINLAGYLNNFKQSKSRGNSMKEEQSEQEESINVSALPRRILSSPQVYDLIYQIFNNPKFQQLNQTFYKLLSSLETDLRVSNQTESQIYQIFKTQHSIYKIGYALEIANAKLTTRSHFYYNFWANSGLQIFTTQISSFCQTSSIYSLDPFLKESVLPIMMKIINMYVSELLGQEHIVRFIYKNKINCMDLQDFIQKIKESEGKQIGDLKRNKQIIEELQNSQSADSILAQVYSCSFKIFTNLVKTYEQKKTDFLQKLTAETVRALASFTTRTEKEKLNTVDLVLDLCNGLLNIRRSIAIVVYLELFYSGNANETQIQSILQVLIEKMPLESKIENYNYFSLMHEIVKKYLEFNQQTGDKDQFFTHFSNKLLDRLFELPGEPRAAYFSDKVILGILSTLNTILSKKSVCQALSCRKIEIIEKCLFAYNIQQKLQSLEITKEMLQTQKQGQHFKNYILCKSEDTRNLAYSIVIKLHEISPNEDFIERYIFPIVQGIKNDVNLTGQKSLDVGLKNFGSTCYMNSMLQVLNSVGPFRNQLVKCQSQAPLVKEMKKLLTSLFYSERLNYAPTNLLNAFIPPIHPGIQQDTTQFLNLLFDQLESGISSTPQKHIIDQIFKGATTIQMICHSCGYNNQRKQSFFSFGVEIDGKFDLQSAMEGSYQGEIISDYFCDSCKNRGETTKRNILSDIPSILFIHLRRIVFNYDIFANMKIHTRLQFPEEFSIEPFTKEGVELREQLGLEYLKNMSHNEEELKKFQQMTLHGKQKDFYKLKLKGVIVHSGSADVGHYYSIISQDKSWRKYDDSKVSMFTTSGFQNECFGGSWTSEEWGSGSSVNAYVLVYQKVVKNPIRVSNIVNDKQQQIEIAYDGIKVYNNPEDYRQIWLDNHNFMVETHLLHEKIGKGFIDFICKLIEIAPPESNKIQLISEIIYKISYHSCLVGDLQSQLITNSESATPEILYAYILQDKQKTFKLLLNNDKNLRQFMSFYINIVLLESFKKGDDKVKLDVLGFIIQILNAMTGEVAKNWLRVDGYFKLLFLLVTHSVKIPQIWRLFMERNLISTLIDFVMQKQSPVRINPKNYSLGTKSHPMDFTFGICIIKFLVGYSYGLTGRNYQVPSVPEELLYHLNNNDVICLSHIEFYSKMLKERQNLRELGQLIQRLCILNLDFSRAIIEVVLQTISSITDAKDEMSDLSSVCLSILNIRDDYWRDRAQMLLGVGLPYVLNNNLMTNFDDERFTFSSTIIDIFPVECLFSYVHLYKLKNSLACFQLIKAIVHGCSVSDVAIKYLIKQPAPSYLFKNYIESIENFVNHFIPTLNVQTKHRQRLEEEVRDLQKYFQDLRNISATQKDQYKSVITGQTSNKRELESLEKDGIVIKLYEYDVECLQSNPSNGNNLPFGEYLHGYSVKTQYSAESDIWKFMRKPAKPIEMGPAKSIEQEKKQIDSLFDDDPYPTIQNLDPNPNLQKLTTTQKQEQKQTQLKKQCKQIQLQPQVSSTPFFEITEPNLPIASFSTLFKSPYFHQIEVINTTKQKKVVKISLSSQQHPNSVIPLNFGWKISTKVNESLWLAKQDISLDWGQVSLKFQVQTYDKDIHEKKNITKWWFKSYGQQGPVNDILNMQDQQNENEEFVTKKDENEMGDADQVNCPVCTSFNAATNQFCDVCTSSMK